MQLEEPKANQNKKCRDQKQLHEIVGMIQTFVIVFLITSVVFGFIVGPGSVKGNSMSPTLRDKELVLLWKLGTNYQAQDIVFLEIPEEDNVLVKRIIGVPGDKVEINQMGQVLLNDKLLEETYIAVETYPVSGEKRIQIQLGQGEYFVLGDNRVNSSDSRTFGVVREDGIRGKVIPIF